MSKLKLRCSGVPEHFNFPWRKVLEKSDYKDFNFELQWTEDPSGTGSMCRRLQNGDIDIAVLLLDGAIKNYASANFKIFSFYVNTPIVWGVYANAHSTLSKGNVKNPSFAISRYTSGSHLMAYLYAKKNNLKLNDSSFEVIGDLNGAQRALKTNMNQLFLWEKFTTKHLVEQGHFKCIDYCPTPWPAFVIVVSNQLLDRRSLEVSHLVQTVQETAIAIKHNPNSINEIASIYNLKKEDVAQWIDRVQWSSSISVDESTILSSAKILLDLGVIDTLPNLDDLIAHRNSTTE